MNWYLIFYFYSVIDKLNLLFGWMAGLSTVAFVVLLIVRLVNKAEVNNANNGSNTVKTAEKWLQTIIFPFRLSVFLGVLAWLMLILTPTKKDALLIIAGGAVGEFITTDSSARQLPSDITKFLHAEIVDATKNIGQDLIREANVDKVKSLTREQLEKLALEKLDSAKAILK